MPDRGRDANSILGYDYEDGYDAIRQPITNKLFLVLDCWQDQHEMAEVDLCGIQKLFAIIALRSLRHRLSLHRSNGGDRLGYWRHLNLDVPCCCAVCL